MADWVTVCASREVGNEPVRHTLPDDTDVVLVRHKGQVLAMNNRCPHKKASLHKSGDIEDLGGDLGLCLRCPKHKSKFGGGLFVSFATGKCVTRKPCSNSKKAAAWAVPVFETKEFGGHISIRRAIEGERAETSIVKDSDELHKNFAAQVVRIRRVSPDSHEFTLKLLSERDRAAFACEPAAMWHIWLFVGGVSREYTPISSSSETARTGMITLLIKLYTRGSMSQQLAKTAAGDLVTVSPPRVTLRVPALEEAPMPHRMSFNFLVGGTGIAPCLQFLRRAKLAGASVRMLYSISTHEDVLLAAELEDIEECWPDQGFSSTLLLTQEMSESREPKRPRTMAIVGKRIDDTIVREHLKGGRTDTVMTIISGPAGFSECCDELIRRLLEPAERGEIVVLDA